MRSSFADPNPVTLLAKPTTCPISAAQPPSLRRMDGCNYGSKNGWMDRRSIWPTARHVFAAVRVHSCPPSALGSFRLSAELMRQKHCNHVREKAPTTVDGMVRPPPDCGEEGRGGLCVCDWTRARGSIERRSEEALTGNR
ncbi:hypothetical protein Mp_5g07970 [Marchantia polymorpha subsp. ruderalis]|uniref:Uncharacterized protein n=2 Tax=Marchantia polymorpha TaxID=3197 RepID=A0AAF6BG29_MARPO|nr:hypothetical protein MARPO_0086s0001 [Marchantia polymorpha]BBN10963.1 hypothetical protein Mp_5g07970 [Marchantia polymorpha subsp. ruderalis]|eukprot:PTQ33661.1 hypothetical protein MARPO_0086s0001 [Marchantia polymorpha]